MVTSNEIQQGDITRHNWQERGWVEQDCQVLCAQSCLEVSKALRFLSPQLPSASMDDPDSQ